MQDSKNDKIGQTLRALEARKNELIAQKKTLELEPSHKSDSGFLPLNEIGLIDEKVNALDFAIKELIK